MADTSATLTSIGVGAVYNGALAEPFRDHPDWVDVVSVIPETLWHQRPGAGGYEWINDAVQLFDVASQHHPVVFHGIGLSLGSAGPLDLAHVDQLQRAAQRYAPRWFSEHLAAFRVQSPAGSAHAGVGLPLAFDEETLRSLAPKVSELRRRLDVPILIENSAIYVDVPYVPWTEAGLLNRLCEETGCGVLLDLHNLFANENNLGWDAAAYLEELDLANVVEIHVAGGESLGRWYTDAHSCGCPERVWNLLEDIIADSRMLRLVTFELHESRYESLGEAGFVEQLRRIREITTAVVGNVA